MQLFRFYTHNRIFKEQLLPDKSKILLTIIGTLNEIFNMLNVNIFLYSYGVRKFKPVTEE